MSIYARIHSVIFSSAQKEERKGGVRVEVESHDGGLSSKELLLRVWDEEAMTFMFCLRIDSDIFQELKGQQGLLVDFGAFGQRLVDLLSMCAQEEAAGDKPRYVLKMVQGGQGLHATLNIVETNPFKHLTHLSLRLSPGDPETVRAHLVACVRAVRAESAGLRERLAGTEAGLGGRLAATEAALAETRLILERQETAARTKLEDARQQAEEQARSLRVRLEETETLYRAKADQDRRDLEEAVSRDRRAHDQRLQQLEATTKSLSEENSRLEAEVREGRRRLEAAETGLSQREAEGEACMRQAEGEAQLLRTRVAVLEQEVRDKEQLVGQGRELCQSEQEARARSQEEAGRRARQADRLDKAVRSLNEEVAKGNQIIERLQAENKHCHSKIKVRSQIAAEQEKLLAEREEEARRLRAEAEEARRRWAQTEEERQRAVAGQEEAARRLEEAQSVLRTNENVIGWLNRQVTEYELLKQRTAVGGGRVPPESVPGPVPASSRLQDHKGPPPPQGPADGHQQSLSSAYFPRTLLGPRK